MLRLIVPALVGAAALSIAGSANSTILVYTAVLLGSNEVPPTGSAATGFSTVTVDDVANTLEVNESFSGLSSPGSAAHIHCCTPEGANTGIAVPFPSFPAATSGAYDMTFDLLNASIYLPTFLSGLGGGTAVGAENALLTGLASGMAYANIHDANFPGGEIRGFLTAAVPEPGAWVLMIAGFGLVGATLRRRQASPT